MASSRHGLGVTDNGRVRLGLVKSHRSLIGLAWVCVVSGAYGTGVCGGVNLTVSIDKT